MASERERAQTVYSDINWGWELRKHSTFIVEQSGKVGQREWQPRKRNESECGRVPEYHRTRGVRWEYKVDHHLRLNTTKWPIVYSTVRERWKEPREGSEIESETICLQAEKARLNVWSRTFCRTDRRVTLCSKVKVLSTEAAAKASLNRAL